MKLPTAYLQKRASVKLRRMTAVWLGGLCLGLLELAANDPQVVELWPGKPPDETGNIGSERVRMSPKLDRKQVEVTEPTRMITDVAVPTIAIQRPAKEKDTGTALVICPGGGYWDLYWQLEGEEVAAWANSVGMTGIILKYRVPRRPVSPSANRPVARFRTRSAPSAWSGARLRNGVSIRSASASWVFLRAAIWPSRRRRVSTNAATRRRMPWTKSYHFSLSSGGMSQAVTFA